MTKLWALIGIDGEVFVTSPEKERLVKLVLNDPLYSYTTLTEMEYNDAPITERGEKLIEQLRDLLKDCRGFHMNKQVGFYAMHIDDRYQLIYDVLTGPMEPFEFGDRHFDESLETKEVSDFLQEKNATT
jgi:hypothetical protein